MEVVGAKGLHVLLSDGIYIMSTPGICQSTAFGKTFQTERPLQLHP